VEVDELAPALASHPAVKHQAGARPPPEVGELAPVIAVAAEVGYQVGELAPVAESRDLLGRRPLDPDCY
jgi:hypothetical protein